jgi:serine/threonine protein kinase
MAPLLNMRTYSYQPFQDFSAPLSPCGTDLRGSRTVVYRAVQPENQQSVVIKILRNEHPSFSELVQFRNQYAIAANLDIPGIVQPLSLAPHSNGYVLIMEDVGGISLRQFARGQSLTVEQFFPIALQVIDILQPLHQQRVIHKDIKPANILIHPETQISS